MPAVYAESDLIQESLGILHDIPKGVIVVPAQLGGAAQQLHH